EDLAPDIDGDLAGKVASRHRGRDLGEIADLIGEVAAHGIDRVGQILPGAGDARHDRLAAELAVGADLAGNSCHFRGKRSELVDHRIDGLLELLDLATDIDGDLLRQVAIGDRDRYVGDVAYLGGQVRRHRVDALGQLL